jgi:TfoX/Sxy family transcriptional regulator of competence genes
MQKWIKASPELQERFKACASKIPGAQGRKMFGYESFFINGNFAAGLWQNTAVFKLSEEDAAAFMKIKGAKPFAPMKGRVMSHWYEAPEELAKDSKKLAAWCSRAAEFAANLPLKKKKESKKK